MRIKIDKQNFGDITQAVFYRFTKYPSSVPIELSEDNLRDFSAVKVMWRGSKKNLGMEALLEYDFKYELEQGKYDDTILPNLFSSRLLEDCGKNIETLEQLSNSLFPTLFVETEATDEDFFFGSDLINDKTVYVLELPEDVWKVEFYESIVTTNHNLDVPGVAPFIDPDYLRSLKNPPSLIVSPALTVTLGPSPENTFNPTSFYFSSDPKSFSDNRKGEEGGEKAWRDGMIEIQSRKAVVIYNFPSSTSSLEVNLSYRSWLISKDPNRNMKKYYLRNDVWNALREKDNVFIPSTSSPSLLVDSRNGSLVGNSLQPSLPLLLKKKLAKAQASSEFSLFRCYGVGDEVEWQGEKWVSTIEHNLGSLPTLGTGWIRKDYVSSILTDRVSVYINPPEAGIIQTPSSNITIVDPEALRNSTGVRRYFKIVESPGWSFTGSTSPTNSSIIIGDEEKSVGILDSAWYKAINNNNRAVVLHFAKTGCSMYVNLVGDVSISGNRFSQWSNFLGEASGAFGRNNFYIRFEVAPGGVYSESLTAKFNQIPAHIPFELHFPKLSRHQPSHATLTYTTISGNVEEEFPFTEVPGKGWVAKMNSEFSNSKCSIWLTPRKISINTIIAGNFPERVFEISNPRATVEYGADSFTVEFYPIDDVMDIKYVRLEGNGLKEGTFITLPVESHATFGKCRAYYHYNPERSVYQVTFTGTIVDDIKINVITP